MPHTQREDGIVKQIGCGAVVYGVATGTGRTSCGVTIEAFGVRTTALCDTCKDAQWAARATAGR